MLTLLAKSEEFRTQACGYRTGSHLEMLAPQEEFAGNIHVVVPYSRTILSSQVTQFPRTPMIIKRAV